MSKRFLISVAAAALIAGTGFANAQGTGMSKESPSTGGGAATQHSAPSGGAMERDNSGMKGSEHSTKGEGTGMKGAESEKSGAATKGAQENTQKSKSMSSETERDKAGASKDMKAESREKSGNMSADKADKSGTSQTHQNAQTEKDKAGTSTNQNAQTKSPTDTNRAQTNDTSRTQTTTGNAATSATAAPPPEKRSQITTAIKSEKIEETTNVNFNIAVGSTIPATVRFHPLPSRIVEIYPEWRGYEVVFVKGRYIIVRPQTHEIVYIIEG